MSIVTEPTPSSPDASTEQRRSQPPPPPFKGSGGDVRDTPVPLVLFLGGLAYLGVTVGWWVVAAVIGIVLMIFLHELGHYVAAKRGGMKVTEFYLGFGPRLWSFTRGETTYGLKAIPLGAYVRIIGMSNLEEVAPEDEPRAYRQATYPRRMAVAVAGSTMHFFQAFVLLMILYVGLGVPTGAWTIRSVTEGSPASILGLQPGDRLLRIGDQPVGKFTDLAPLLVGSNGADTSVTYARGNQTLTASAVIAERFNSSIAKAVKGLETGDRLVSVDGSEISTYSRFAAIASVGGSYRVEVVRLDKLCSVDATVNDLPPAREVTRGFLGVSPDFATARKNPLVAAGRSVGDFGEVTSAAVSGIGRFFQPSHVGSFVADSFRAGTSSKASGTCRSLTADENRVMSIYGFGKIASDAGRQGVANFLRLFALFNIFIGVFNLLPTLPFDGGHVVVATYERLRSRHGKRYHADMAKLLPVVYAVAGLMVFLGLLALFRDIIQPPSIGG